MVGEPDLAGPAAGIAAATSRRDCVCQVSQRMIVQFRCGKALVAGKPATSDIIGDHNLLGAGACNGCELRVETHATAAAGDMQHDRPIQPPDLDPWKDEVMQEIGDVDNRDRAAGRGDPATQPETAGLVSISTRVRSLLRPP